MRRGSAWTPDYKSYMFGINRKAVPPPYIVIEYPNDKEKDVCGLNTNNSLSLTYPTPYDE